MTAFRWLILSIVVLFVAVGGLLVMVAGSFDRWRDWCEEQGGHVLSRSTAVVTGNGVGIASTHYCLTDDGRVLDIR